MSRAEFDLCIIGAGAGGLSVAAGAAALGAKVALVERHRLGGDCLWTGCVPSKALIHCARVAHTVRTAGRDGISASPPDIHLPAVMARVRDAIATLAPHDSPERFRALGVEVIFGDGRFTGPHQLDINGRVLTARRYVIATGSRPARPDLPGLDGVRYLTNETVFDLNAPVPELIILGGGPIGVELAQAFARLGTRVHVVQRGGQLLPREDADLAAVVTSALRADGVTLHLNAQALDVRDVAGVVHLRIQGPAGVTTLTGSHLLIAAGRKSNIEQLELAAAGVTVDDGKIVTDHHLRTTARHIYACGDVTGGPLFTHMAEHHAGVILRHALFHLPARVETRAMPWCTYTDPELARVGLSEQEARVRGLRHEVHRFSFEGVDRATIEGETAGLAKLITGPQGRILGAAIAGSHAGELIQEYVLAIRKRMRARDISSTLHIYPTLAQINRRVADQRLKAALTPRMRRWMQRLFGLRGA